MRNINKVILIGNVARAPEVRTTTNGQKMTTFVLATNRTWHDPQGHKQSQAEFHNMLAWGKIAEICQRFLQKSTLVYAEGYLKTRSWENENNTRFYRTEIVIQDILVLDRGIRHEGNGNGDSYQYDNNNDSFDFGSDDFSDDSSGNDNEEKPASEIEKSFHEKLSQGNESVADTSLGSFSEDDFDKKTISLDEPLFEEESK
jgi:single-strand DNA-binding protein